MQTTELTRLQVGTSGPVNIIVSTVIEAESILPLLLEYKEHGRLVNVRFMPLIAILQSTNISKLLYGLPISPTSESTIHRLSVLLKALGPHGLSLLIDHPAQLRGIESIRARSGIAPDVFLKIDSVYSVLSLSIFSRLCE